MSEAKDLYIKQSSHEAALRLEKVFSKSLAGILAFFSGMLALIFLFATSAFLEQKEVARLTLAASEIFVSSFLFFGLLWLFANFLQGGKNVSVDELKRALDKAEYGTNLTFFAVQILNRTGKGSELLLRDFFDFLLKYPEFKWVLRRLNINPDFFRKKIASEYSPQASLPLEQVLKDAWQKAIGQNHLELRYSDLLVAVFDLDQVLRRIMFDEQVEESDLLEVSFWQRRREFSAQIRGKFWDRENLLNIKGIGKGWSGGFTINLDRVARDLTEEVNLYKIPPDLYGRSSDIELLERMLVRSGSSGNVVLVGAPGIGRHTILRSFSARVNTGQTLGPLRYMRILEIDSAAILSGKESLNEVIEKIQLLFGEAYLAENIILVIDDIDALFDASKEVGRVNATEALLPFLQSRLRIIGTTTARGYQTTIGKNPQLERVIGKLEISELSSSQTLTILQDAAVGIERQPGSLFFSHAALKEIVKLATKLIQNLPNPEKSLEILEEAAVYVSNKTSDRVILPVHVQKVITARTKVPVEKVAGQEKEVLLNLEEILHERIVNQHEAIRELADALRRARSGIRSEKRPIGSFLFLGPTGVGKTETTKALAGVYFGSESRILRFDMSEFQEVHSVNRLIGDADANTGGILTEAVIASPFSLILLDEIEKAHPKILDLFLQVFDEGRLTDALGRTVSFVNTMIVATSNAGAEHIRQMVKEGRNPATEHEALLDDLQRQGIFRPEFLNRFDAVIVYRPLTEEELTQVCLLLLKELNERLAEKDIQLNITPELAKALAKGGYSPEFGARPLRRYIQEHVENHIARGLISGEIQRGQVVEIDPQMLTSSSP